MTPRLAACLSLSLFVAALPAHAQNGFKFLDDEAEAGGYDVSAQLTQLPAEWWIARQEDGSGYRVTVKSDGISLGIQHGNNVTPLAETKITAAPGATFVAQRRGPRWNLLVNNQTVLRAEDDAFNEGQIGYRGTLKDARVQPVEPIAFDDDFMRVASDVALAQARNNPRQGIRITDAQITEDIWTAVQGKWQTTGLTENPEAQVAQSANPFAFRAAEAGTSIALAGRPFWDDYAASVSIKPEGASAVGILAYAQDAKNYLGLIWTDKSDPVLRAVVNGVPRILGQAKGFGAFENKQWYRFKVAVSGSTVRGFIDDQEVVRAQTGLFGRGQIGLYCEAATATDTVAFDDASVRSITDFYDDFSAPVPGRWKNITGVWNMTGAARPVGKDGAFTVMGEPDWSDYTVAANLELPASGATGLVLHHIPGKGSYLLRIAGSKAKLPYAGKVQILKVGGGKNQVLGEYTAGSRLDNTTQRWTFSGERGYLRASTGTSDDDLNPIVDAFDVTLADGRAGLYAQAGAGTTPKATNFAVEFPVVRSTWAKVPDLYELEQQAQTMGGWSTPQGFWVPVSTSGSEGKMLRHKGAFYGDDTLRFQLPDLTGGKALQLEFGVAAGKEIQIKMSGADALKVDLTSAGGAQSATEKFDSLANLPVEISRRGTFVIIRAGAADKQKVVMAARVG
jgi:hypothetical protein